jgi:hypothetical protein
LKLFTDVTVTVTVVGFPATVVTELADSPTV